MKERIQAIINEKGLTAWRFADLLDVQPSNISHILAGRNKPSFDFIEKVLLRFEDINPEWLVLGKGDMFRDDSSSKYTYSEEEFFAPNDSVAEEEVILEEPELYVTNVNTIEIQEDITEELITDSIVTNVKDTENKQDSIIDNPITLSVIDDEVEHIMILYKDGTFKQFKQRK